MADISQINLPDGTTYNLKDSYARTNYVFKAGDTMTGNLTAPKFIGALQGNADTATNVTWTGITNKPDVATEQEIASYTEASGSIATFSDGSPLPMRSLKAYIEPVQDLHGYDEPWVGGAGKNKCPVDKIATTPSDTFSLPAGSYTFSFRLIGTPKYSTSKMRLDDENDNNIVKIGVHGVSQNTYLDIQFTLSETTTVKVRNENITVDSSGYVADNIQIESGGSRTTFAPYSNICPIIGWTACNVVDSGKNLSPYSNISNNSRSTAFLLPKGNYTFSFRLVGTPKYTTSMIRLVSGEDGVATKQVYWTTVGNYESVQFTLTESTTVQIQSVNVTNDSGGHAADNIQIELDSQATTYEPYNGSTYTIDLDGTRYGGTLDVVSGVLVVDKAIVDLGDLSWSNSSNGWSITNGISSSAKSFDNNTIASAKCSIYKADTASNVYRRITNNTIGINNASSVQIYDIRFIDKTGTEIADILDGVQLVYELATPQTIQLTPTQVKSLLGVNNVWADTGDVELEYQPQNVIAELRDEIQQAESNVKQIPADYDNVDYELLLSSSNSTTEEVGSTHKSASLQYNDSYTSFTHGNRKNNTGKGVYSFSTGAQNTVSGNYAQAEGNNCTATGIYSHAQGYASKATDRACQAEGWSTEASGDFGAHAEGDNTKATGRSSHAEGSATTASGAYSHTGGLGTKASGNAQCVIGKYNIDDTSGNYGFIIGNGTSATSSNALTVNWNGNTWIAGSLTQGSSRKVKTNIEPINISEIEKILELDGVKFDYIINGTDTQLERGFIAEDVAKILPAVVTPEQTNEDGNMIVPASINYIALIPYLVEICKKQQAEIDELKRNIFEES